MTQDEQAPKKYVTNNELALELRALRSDVKLWILAAVAMNQFLASIDLPSSVTGAAVIGVVGKSVLPFLIAIGKAVVSVVFARFGA